MSLIVNTNIASIDAQRNLSLANSSLSTAMQRLSSGLRINSAADDAAGMAIATGLQAQVNGLTQATRNANDGISVIGTAEGAVTQETNILQTIRTLAVQAANDINSASNRSSIQTEINQQIAELTRIGNTTNFNGQNLLDGSFANKNLQVGANSGQTINFSLGDFRAAAMGSIAQLQGVTNKAIVGSGSKNSMIISTIIDGSANAGAGLTGATIQVGTTTTAVAATVSDGISSNFSTGSAIAKANAINAVTAQTGVTATAGPTVWQGNAITTVGLIGATTTLDINGVRVIDGSTDQYTSSLNDSNGNMRARINAKSNQTGVTASLDAGNHLILTAADGRNIVVKTGGVAATAFADTGVGKVGALADGTIAANTADQAGGVLTLTSNSAFTITSDATAATEMLGLTTTVNQHAMQVNLNANLAVNTINVTTAAGASQAIQVVDSALATIGTAQSQLGALTNRLQDTVANLQVSIENLSSSQSRIQDADFATETANMTRAQIIEQAGVSVLAQANIQPQYALSLLPK